MKKKMFLFGLAILILFVLSGRIIYLKTIRQKEENIEEREEKVLCHNVWIIKGKGTSLKVYMLGEERSLQTKSVLTEEITNVVADITLRGEKVEKIQLKPEKISGKVLRVTDESIELQGYPELETEDTMQIYSQIDGITMAERKQIMVGYDIADFVISDGKIAAILIRKELVADKIRVLIQSENYQGIYHKAAELVSNQKYRITIGEEQVEVPEKEVLEVQAKNGHIELFGTSIKGSLEENRIRIEPAENNAMLEWRNLVRSSGHPKYRGCMEFVAEGDQLLCINELSMEEYLYGVLPSEMPSDYNMEALKSQAICARTYAYMQVMNNACAANGAHVDDSTSYQVYNNYPETKESMQAVDETYGTVLTYQDNVISTYYFSTSCGMTTSGEEVWLNQEQMGYLQGDFVAEDSSEEILTADQMQQEEQFRKFLTEKENSAFEKNQPWYRWKVEIDLTDVKKSIDRNLMSRYRANKDLVQTWIEDSYQSVPVDTVGAVEKIEVTERGTGGIVKEIVITGSKNKVKVTTEYNIRSVLAPSYDSVIRQDKSKIDGMSMLPSAFFVLDSKKTSEGNSVVITGGGYGHGVGMSQNGAQNMAQGGKTCDEILQFFYKNTEYQTIYQISDDQDSAE